MGFVLLNYDVKWPHHDLLEGGYAPPNVVKGISFIPDTKATIMIRRRIHT
jgi:hypothetical protein